MTGGQYPEYEEWEAAWVTDGGGSSCSSHNSWTGGRTSAAEYAGAKALQKRTQGRAWGWDHDYRTQAPCHTNPADWDLEPEIPSRSSCAMASHRHSSSSVIGYFSFRLLAGSSRGKTAWSAMPCFILCTGRKW